MLASPLEVCDTCSTCPKAPFDVVSTALSKGVPCCPVRDQTTRLDSKPFALASLSRIKWTSRRALKGKRRHKTCCLRGERWMLSNEAFFIFVAPGPSRRPSTNTNGESAQNMFVDWMTNWKGAFFLSWGSLWRHCRATLWGQRMEGSWHGTGVPCQDLHRLCFSVPENFSQAKFSEPASLKSRFLQAHCVLYSTELKSEGFNSGTVLWGDSDESTYIKAYWKRAKDFLLTYQYRLRMV